MTMLPGANSMRRFPYSVGQYQSITPLTERDGYTFLELLERIRTWIQDDFAAHVDNEIARLIESVNAAIAQLHTVLDDAQASADAAAASAASVAGIEQRVIVIRDAVLAAKTAVDTALEAAISARNTATAAATQATEALEDVQELLSGITIDGSLRALLANPNMTSRQLLDSLYAPKPLTLTEMVVVGNSNVLPGDNFWPQMLATSIGVTPRNYAIGGQAINNGQYLAQLQAARTDSAFQNDKVKFVIIADMGNDIRAKLDNVDTYGPPLLAAARDWFPNARVIVLPVLWPANDRDAATVPGGYQVEWHQVMSVSVAKMRALADSYQAEFVDDSWTWFQGLTGTQIAGEVHFTTPGHSIIARKMYSFISGDTDNHGIIPWTRVPANDSANYNTGPNNQTNGLLVTRDGPWVTLAGQFVCNISPNAGWTIGTIPMGMRPGGRQDFMALWNIEGTMNRMTVNGANGSITVSKSAIAGEIIVVNTTWRIDG